LRGGGFADAAFSVNCNFSHNQFCNSFFQAGGFATG
jgi:hypothetical protein